MILNKLNVYFEYDKDYIAKNSNNENKINEINEDNSLTDDAYKIDLNERKLVDAVSDNNEKISNSISNDSDDESGEEASASRNILVRQLLKQGTFNFTGFIENEVTASALILFKNLAKYYEIPFQEVNRISTDNTYKEKLSEDEYTGWLPKAVEDFGLDWEDVWEPVHKRMDFCYKLAGIPYNSSIAASGVIMATGNTVLPVHDGSIGYNSVDLEQWGYIKYDLLSINTLNSIQYFKGVDFDWNDNGDKKVWDSMKAGDLDFTFQLSGFTTKKMCTEGLGQNDPQWWVHGIERISEISATNRPGPLSIDMDKIWVKLQRGEFEYTDKNDMIINRVLKSGLGNSHLGLIMYQEDIMSLCSYGAKFTLAESDDVRKGMGKKKQELIDAKKPQFINNWKYDDIIEISGLGFFKNDDLLILHEPDSNGKHQEIEITAKEAYDRLENGEKLDLDLLLT